MLQQQQREREEEEELVLSSRYLIEQHCQVVEMVSALPANIQTRIMASDPCRDSQPKGNKSNNFCLHLFLCFAGEMARAAISTVSIVGTQEVKSMVLKKDGTRVPDIYTVLIFKKNPNIVLY